MNRVFVALLMLLAGCASQSLPDKGVSKQLAEQRKSQIDSVTYQLSFTIPQQLSQPIEGECRVGFWVDKPCDIILDFKSDTSNLTFASTACRKVNEHIVVDKRNIDKGHNSLTFRFKVNDRIVNRRDDYLYTLLVPDRARVLFPCFDQPDMKAEYQLQLTVPKGWQAVSNTKTIGKESSDTATEYLFDSTEPLSTYLFSFVAGEMEVATHQSDKRTLRAFYRESDPQKVAQLDEIFAQVEAAIDWMEHYTQIPYPFAKYDFIILPGFQYGGMEHTGATLYNDTRMFLSQNPSIDQELARAELIAHETAHMWFGDLVTMRWFNDVWIKEVFAGYFASRIIEPRFPQIDHSLRRLKNFYTKALTEDRTHGAVPISQELDNLTNAGLIYSNTIYFKAPVMMLKLVEFMGEEGFHAGIREYLDTYAYANASWEELVEILSRHTQRDVKQFGKVWVETSKMATIEWRTQGNELTVAQSDSEGRGVFWPQSFEMLAIDHAGNQTPVAVELTQQQQRCTIPNNIAHIVPNSNGKGYGRFVLERESADWLLKEWPKINTPLTRQSVVMTLFENCLDKHIDAFDFAQSMIAGIDRETNALVLSTCTEQLTAAIDFLTDQQRETIEESLLATAMKAETDNKTSRQLFKVLFSKASSERIIDRLYELWETQSVALFGERDYMDCAFSLAIRLPARREQTGRLQRQRITGEDRLREFEYVWPATTPDTAQLDSLFERLLEPQNRQIEPWTLSVLSLLNHPSRQKHALKYVARGLEELGEVQLTGDIFFPRSWAGSLLGGHQSREAYQIVRDFVDRNPCHHSDLLISKILFAAYPLYRTWDESSADNNTAPATK